MQLERDAPLTPKLALKPDALVVEGYDRLNLPLPSHRFHDVMKRLCLGAGIARLPSDREALLASPTHLGDVAGQEAHSRQSDQRVRDRLLVTQVLGDRQALFMEWAR